MSEDGAAAPEPGSPPPSADRRKWLLWALRFVGTAAAFAYVLSIVDVDDVGRAIGAVAWWAFLAACALTAVNLFVGAVRWRVLLSAYGASAPPSLMRLAHAYWVGFFYNNYLPGGVGGDVVRGVLTREAFGDRGATASMTVVLVERALGLSGLLIVVAITFLVRPIEGVDGVLWFAALGLVAAATGVAAVAIGRRLASILPGKLGELAARLPEIERPLPFAGALAISLVTQGLVATTGWVLLASVTDGAVGLLDAFAVVPLAMAAVYFPFSVGGAGVREAAFVSLCTTALAMERADALAVSLVLWATQLAMGAVGGALQAVAPAPREDP